MMAFHHLPADLKRAGFVEIHRVLKPGGRFLAIDLEMSAHHLFASLSARFFGREMVQSGIRILTTELEEAGFCEVSAGRTRHRVISYLRGMAR